MNTLNARQLQEHIESSPASGPRAILPPAPRSLAEAGLPEQFLLELAAKVLLQRGSLQLTELAQQIKLPALVLAELLDFMRGECVVELVRRGSNYGDVVYGLTRAGRAHANEFLRRCHYVGPAPVPLPAYAAQLRLQSVSHLQLTRREVEQAFSDMILTPGLRQQLGSAINSGRPIFLYGPPGSGKTYLAEQLVRLLHGCIAVPHAFLVDGEVVQVFDPLVHHPLQDTASTQVLDMRGRTDQRWVACERPVVITGGELRLETLELQFDPKLGYYRAPPHLKAANGLFVVDDLGRQIVTPEQLMNRWIVPLDRRRDCLTLHNGASFELPFDLVLVFSSNLTPAQVADEAFMRRLGYKIQVGEQEEDAYREILRGACSRYQVRYTEEGWAELKDLHRRTGQPRLASYPYDLVGLVRDLAAYQSQQPKLDQAAVWQAWHNYFTPETT